MPSLYNRCVLYYFLLNLFWRVLFQYRWLLGMFSGISYEYDLLGGLIIPRDVSLGFLIRLGVVCLADFAVKNAIFRNRLLVIVWGDIIYYKIIIKNIHKINSELKINPIEYQKLKLNWIFFLLNIKINLNVVSSM